MSDTGSDIVPTDDDTDVDLAALEAADAVEYEQAAKRWPPWTAGVLEGMRTVPSLARVSERVGISRRQVQRLAKRDATFAAALQEARDVALDSLEEVALMRARTGQPVKKTVTKKVTEDGKEKSVETTVTEESHLSDVLLIFYLKRWRPEYRDTFNVRHGGVDGGPVQVEVYRDPSRERLLALARLAQELELPQGVDPIIDGTTSNGNGNGVE